MHSELCNPSADTQAIAKRAAGVYSGAIPLDKMMDILDIVEGGGNTNSIRFARYSANISRLGML
jgi:hypothetical protein